MSVNELKFFKSPLGYEYGAQTHRKSMDIKIVKKCNKLNEKIHSNNSSNNHLELSVSPKEQRQYQYQKMHQNNHFFQNQLNKEYHHGKEELSVENSVDCTNELESTWNTFIKRVSLSQDYTNKNRIGHNNLSQINFKRNTFDFLQDDKTSIEELFLEENVDIIQKFQNFLKQKIQEKALTNNLKIPKNKKKDQKSNDGGINMINLNDKLLKNAKIDEIVRTISKKIDFTNKIKEEKFENKLKIFNRLPSFINISSFIKHMNLTDQNKRNINTKNNVNISMQTMSDMKNFSKYNVKSSYYGIEEDEEFLDLETNNVQNLLTRSKSYVKSKKNLNNFMINDQLKKQIDQKLNYENQMNSIVHDDNAENRFYENLVNDFVNQKFVYHDIAVQDIDFDEKKMNEELEKICSNRNNNNNFKKQDINDKLNYYQDFKEKSEKITKILKKQAWKIINREGFGLTAYEAKRRKDLKLSADTSMRRKDGLLNTSSPKSLTLKFSKRSDHFSKTTQHFNNMLSSTSKQEIGQAFIFPLKKSNSIKKEDLNSMKSSIISNRETIPAKFTETRESSLDKKFKRQYIMTEPQTDIAEQSQNTNLQDSNIYLTSVPDSNIMVISEFKPTKSLKKKSKLPGIMFLQPDQKKLDDSIDHLDMITPSNKLNHSVEEERHIIKRKIKRNRTEQHLRFINDNNHFNSKLSRKKPYILDQSINLIQDKDIQNQKLLMDNNKSIPLRRSNSGIKEAKKIVDEFIDSINDIKLDYQKTKRGFLRQIKEIENEYDDEIERILPSTKKLDYLKFDKKNMMNNLYSKPSLNRKMLNVFLSS